MSHKPGCQGRSRGGCEAALRAAGATASLGRRRARHSSSSSGRRPLRAEIRLQQKSADLLEIVGSGVVGCVACSRPRAGTEVTSGFLSELWDAEPRHGEYVQQVRFQAQGRHRAEVQGHDADDERPRRRPATGGCWSGTRGSGCSCPRRPGGRSVASSRRRTRGQAHDEGHDAGRGSTVTWCARSATGRRARRTSARGGPRSCSTGASSRTR